VIDNADYARQFLRACYCNYVICGTGDFLRPNSRDTDDVI